MLKSWVIRRTNYHFIILVSRGSKYDNGGGLEFDYRKVPKETFQLEGDNIIDYMKNYTFKSCLGSVRDLSYVSFCYTSYSGKES